MIVVYYRTLTFIKARIPLENLWTTKLRKLLNQSCLYHTVFIVWSKSFDTYICEQTTQLAAITFLVSTRMRTMKRIELPKCMCSVSFTGIFSPNQMFSANKLGLLKQFSPKFLSFFCFCLLLFNFWTLL